MKKELDPISDSQNGKKKIDSKSSRTRNAGLDTSVPDILRYMSEIICGVFCLAVNACSVSQICSS